jgi:hypothetical protein
VLAGGEEEGAEEDEKSGEDQEWTAKVHEGASGSADRSAGRVAGGKSSPGRG